MALTIGSSDNQSFINRLRQTDDSKQKSLARIASGQRIQSAADDAAGLAVALSQLEKAAVLSVADRNAQDALSVADQQEFVLATATEAAIDVQVAAVQSRNGTYSDTQRDAINRDSQAKIDEVSRQFSEAKFNGNNVFASTSYQVGTSGGSNNQITSTDYNSQVDSIVLRLQSVDNSTASSAGTAIDTAADVVSQLASTAGNVGALTQRISTARSQIATDQVTTTASAATILDADIAKEASNITNTSIQQKLITDSIRNNGIAKRAILDLLA
jgi:flagellin